MLDLRRRGANRKKPTGDGGNDTSDEDKQRGRCRLVLIIARERIPSVFFLVFVAMVFYDQALRWNRSNIEIYSGNPGARGNAFAADTGDKDKTLVGEALLEVSEHKGSNGKVKRDGFMVLGMHRSGTSMLTGLLYMAAGYRFGGHLYKGGQNPKGFFERFDVVGQNGAWMKNQDIFWNKNVLAYSWEKAVADKESGAVEFNQGERALKFFNNPKNAPWLQKDPRMCLTLKTWLKLNLLKKEPAIVITYRHPLEVALSLEKRNRNLYLTKGFHLWMAYNMRAIQNSRGLCIVRTKNSAILADPKIELQRISDELTTKCGLPRPQKPVSQKEIDKFIDPNLQHHKAANNRDREVLETHNDGTCVVYGFESKKEKGTPKFKQERLLYLRVMKIYCDLESGKAYEEDYEWPDMSEKIL